MSITYIIHADGFYIFFQQVSFYIIHQIRHNFRKQTFLRNFILIIKPQDNFFLRISESGQSVVREEQITYRYRANTFTKVCRYRIRSVFRMISKYVPMETIRKLYNDRLNRDDTDTPISTRTHQVCLSSLRNRQLMDFNFFFFIFLKSINYIQQS